MINAEPYSRSGSFSSEQQSRTTRACATSLLTSGEFYSDARRPTDAGLPGSGRQALSFAMVIVDDLA